MELRLLRRCNLAGYSWFQFTFCIDKIVVCLKANPQLGSSAEDSAQPQGRLCCDFAAGLLILLSSLS